MPVWVEFLLCVAVIVFAGTRLTRYGDILAEKTGLGKTWIGVVLLASVTSLAELVIGLSSVIRYQVPDIAAGDVLGSCMFNILILALLDFRNRGLPISSRAHPGQILSAGFGIVLLSLVALSLFAGPRLPAVGWIGVTSFLFLGLYLLAMRLIFSYERQRIAEFVEDVAEELQYENVPTRRAITYFLLNALAIVVAASFLPHAAEQIARETGLGQTFVGSILVAFTTSLPEVVVSVAALRLGAVDMLYGNLFGSNLFNIAILAVDDLFYLRGPLLTHVGTSHMVTTLGALMMTAIAILGLTYRTDRKPALASWDSLGIAGAYGVVTWMLFLLR